MALTNMNSRHFTADEKTAILNHLSALETALAVGLRNLTAEERQQFGSELSDERKQILFEPGKQLIYSTGITEKQLMTETKGDVNAILNKAFAVYVSQTSPKKQ